MKAKEIITPIYIKAGKAVQSLTEWAEYKDGDAVGLASSCDNAGADAILVFDLSENDEEHDLSIGRIKEIARAVDIPIYGGGNIRRVEDVKKLIYAGCRKIFLNYAKESNVAMTEEVSKRFGKDKILACIEDEKELAKAKDNSELLDGAVFLGQKDTNSKNLTDYIYGFENIYYNGTVIESDTVFLADELLEKQFITGIFAQQFADPDFSIMEYKHDLRDKGIAVNTFEVSLSWDEIKTDSDGLLPVVVQDYKTLEVLMVAYMNREAFEMTAESGRMSYFSRSRQELWIKGLTSGHFQYVRELRIDCDNDTLLAKVAQVGAACHTGNRSCFYRTIMKKEYDETNPMKVFEDVFAVIEDRKLHPKEGSYTNYLFDKGIDKILKKVGEEATEIVIAAKNPDPEEIKYEISDFLYHVMVLMAQKGVTWEDITEELARR